MTEALGTVLPIVLILCLGAGLAYFKFMNKAVMDGLNALVYWIALPALVIEKLSSASFAGAVLLKLCGIFFLASLGALVFASAVSAWLGLRRADVGTVAQASFRGNLAFVGIPVLVYSFSNLPNAEQAELIAIALLVFGPTMIFYNVFSVLALQASQANMGPEAAALLGRRLVTNPLLLAGAIGLTLNLAIGPLPPTIARTLDTLGGFSIPGALLCIGGSLTMVSIRGNRSAIGLATVTKVALLPLFMSGAVHLFGADPMHARILMVFAAAPTAAASYVLAVKMGGNEGIASGSVALSTLLSPVSLVVVLLLF